MLVSCFCCCFILFLCFCVILFFKGGTCYSKFPSPVSNTFYLYTYTHTHAHTHARTHAHTHIRTHTHARTHTHTYIYIYIYIYNRMYRCITYRGTRLNTSVRASYLALLLYHFLLQLRLVKLVCRLTMRCRIDKLRV